MPALRACCLPLLSLLACREAASEAAAVIECGREDAACQAAVARFAEVERSRVAYEAVSPRGSRAEIARGVGEKIRLAGELARAYEELAASAPPELALAATVRVGELYRDCAAAIRRVPCPAGLDAGPCEVMRQQTAEQARALDLRALELFERGEAQARTVGRRSRWSERAQQGREELRAARPEDPGAASP
jgi:hypothetical protein